MVTTQNESAFDVSADTTVGDGSRMRMITPNQIHLGTERTTQALVALYESFGVEYRGGEEGYVNVRYKFDQRDANLQAASGSSQFAAFLWNCRLALFQDAEGQSLPAHFITNDLLAAAVKEQLCRIVGITLSLSWLTGDAIKNLCSIASEGEKAQRMESYYLAVRTLQELRMDPQLGLRRIQKRLQTTDEGSDGQALLSFSRMCICAPQNRNMHVYYMRQVAARAIDWLDQVKDPRSRTATFDLLEQLMPTSQRVSAVRANGHRPPYRDYFDLKEVRPDIPVQLSFDFQWVSHIEEEALSSVIDSGGHVPYLEYQILCLLAEGHSYEGIRARINGMLATEGHDRKLDKSWLTPVIETLICKDRKPKRRISATYVEA